MVRTASRYSSKTMSAASAPDAPSLRSPVSSMVERLARVDPAGHWVVSCYLKLEPRDRARGKYTIKLKNRIRERLGWIAGSRVPRAELEAIARDLDRVREYLADPGNLPPGRGIALFACEPIGLFEALPLPQVFRSRLAIDRTPLVRELAALEDEFGRVLCTVYDRTGARFFDVTAFRVTELTGLAAVDTTRTSRFHGAGSRAGPGTGFSGSGEHNFHQRIKVEKQRHYARIAQHLFDLTRTNPVRGVVLAGTGAEAAAVLPHLHPYVSRLVMGTVRLNPKAVGAPDVLETVLEVRRRSEREWEAQHIRALREKVGTGWAVNGVEATLRALARGQVRTLLVDAETSWPGFRCGGSGRLSLTAVGCSDDGEPDPVPDVIDEAIEEALRQQTQVDVIEGDARSGVDGLAALLRFR